MKRVLTLAGALLLIAAGLACSDDGDSASDEPVSTATAITDSGESTASSTAESGSSDQPSGGESSGGAGTLTLGDNVIELDGTRCFLQEQDVSGSPGKILFSVQGFGTTPDGDEFLLDVSRYDEDSLFTGDDIKVDVGDFRTEDFFSWDGFSDLGTIERDGSTLRAGGLTFRHSKDASELAGAFEIRC